MQFLKNLSIRHKQTLVIMVITSIALLLACTAFVAYDTIAFRQELTQNVSVLADAIGNNCAAAIDFNDPKSAEETLTALRANKNIVAACVYYQGGGVFAIYKRDTAMAFAPPQPTRVSSEEFAGEELHLVRPIKQRGVMIGTIFVASDLHELSARLARYINIVVVVFLAALLLAFLLSNRLQRLISGPILHLLQVTRSVALEKNYSVRATKQGNDELGQLMDEFNEMLSQIQERDANLEGRVAERTLELQLENSERKRAEEAVRESQAQYHSLVEQLPAGIFRKDVAGRYSYVNSWFCRIKGVDPKQYLGRTPDEAAVNEFSQNDPPSLDPAYKKLLADRGVSHHRMIMETGKPVEIEEEYPDAQGQPRIFHIVKTAVFGPDGKIIGSQGILFDITERKRAEFELAYERELLRSLMDHSTDRIYFKNCTSRFIRCSASLSQQFGLQNAEQAIGKCDADFFAGDHAREAYEDEQTIIRTGQPMAKTEKEVWPDGHVTWVLTSKMALRNQDNEIIGTFGISKDITALKETEIKLNEVHKQLLETSRQAGMAEVATGVLHNVGNVLNSVNVASTLVADNIRKSKASNLAKAVALMREHAADLGDFLKNDARGKQLPGYLAQLADHLAQEQAAALHELTGLQKNIEHIKDIVAMQQSYAKISGVTETLEASDLVEDALRMNASALERHEVTAIREFGDVPPVTVDKHKVLQILINLIRNAKYACDDSSRENRQIRLRIARAESHVKISVIDNGVGIPRENLVRIFSHGFTTRKEGHGFGLHSGALAARELGGALVVQSDGPGKGATFTLELPLQPPAISAS